MLKKSSKNKYVIENDKITLYSDFEEEFEEIVEKDKLKKIYTSVFFNKPFDKIKIPEGIEKLRLGNGYNQSINNLPSSITSIFIGKKFDNSIDNLPGNVKKIVFMQSGLFNKPIDYLPQGLEYLVLPNSFNYPLNNLPNSLKILELGDNFDKELNNLPDSIEKLVLSNNYEKEIKRFPKSLRILVISNNYRYSLPNSIEIRKMI